MEVLDGQKVFTSGLNPPLFLQGLAFGTVAVPAGVVGYLDMAAAVAPVLMPSQGRGPAYLHGSHDPQMSKRQAVGASVRCAVLTEDISQLDAVGRPHQRYR